MKKIKGYIFSRPFLDERAPQHIQNIVIREFCKKESLHYSLSAVEYAMSNSHKTLYQLINDLKNLDGIVAYSVFQLPFDNIERNKILKKVIRKNNHVGAIFNRRDFGPERSTFYLLKNIFVIRGSIIISQ